LTLQTDLVSRWRQESSSLYAIQRYAWLNKLRELGFSIPTTSSTTMADGTRRSCSAGGTGSMPAHDAADSLLAAVPEVTVSDPVITHKFYGRSKHCTQAPL